MRRVLWVFGLAMSGCGREAAVSAASDARTPGTVPAASVPLLDAEHPAAFELHAKASGHLHDLRVSGSEVRFCDADGSHTLTEDGSVKPSGLACPAKEEDATSGCNSAFENNQLVGREVPPNEVWWVDIGKGGTVQLKGHMVGCDSDGLVFVFSTFQEVVVFDAARGASRRVANQGAEHVAIGPRWVAWQLGEKIEARRR
jgi:hypothetical protein